MRIKNKMLLRDKLNHGDYVRIAIWDDGTWEDIGNIRNEDIKGVLPARTYTKTSFGEMTHKEITALFKSIELMVLRNRK